MTRDAFQNGHHLIDPYHRIIYCYVAKNACSTMKFHFLRKKLRAENAAISDEEINETVHKISRQHAIADPGTVEFSEYYSFFILRDPFSRIASAFLDKFVRTEALPRYADRLMSEYGPQTAPEQWTFSDFIHAIAKSPVESLNEHWMPQYMHLIEDVDYEFFRIEDIAKSLRLRNIYGNLSKNVREHTLRYLDLDRPAHETPIAELKAFYGKEGQVPSRSSLCHADLEAPIRSIFGPDFELIESVTAGKTSATAVKAPAKAPAESERSSLISVVVPVYNVERFIGECMDSLCRQTDRCFEVIVVDDESSDSSGDIVSTYAQRLPSLRILRQANRGLGGARNTGINLAKGTFITFVDSDDVIEPDYIATLRRTQAATGADVVTGAFRKITEAGESIVEPRKAVPELSPPLAAHEEVLGTFRQSVAWARLYRTSLLQQSGIAFPEKIPHEDLFFTYKMLRLAGRVASTDAVIYNWRQRPGSLGKSITEEYIDVLPELRRDTLRFLQAQGATEREYALAARRNIALTNFFRSKAQRVNRDCLAYFRESLARHSADILEDIAEMEKAGLPGLLIQNMASIVAEARSEFPAAADADTPLDFAFFPLRAYHLLDCLPVYRQLQEFGYSVQIIETDAWRDGRNEVTEAAAEAGVALTAFADFQAQRPRVRCCVVWNDWDPLMRIVMEACHRSGTETIGWIEGIQDYHDVDRGRGVQRCPYLRSRHLILPGGFDARYFRSTGQRLHVGEIVRIARLWHDRPQQQAGRSPAQPPRALINSNFSYGVLEDKRDAWVIQAVESCKATGYEPVISRHPFDKGELYPEYATSKSFYEAIAECDVAIQRFASGILEALAMGISTIYFNPHGEKSDKFIEPNGAYPICFGQAELTGLLRDRRYGWSEGTARAFLADHCGLSETPHPSGGKIAGILRGIADGTVMPIRSLLSALKPLPEPGKVKELRQIGNVIPPFFGLPVSEHSDLGADNQALTLYAASLLLDPVAMLPRVGTGGDLAAQIERLLAVDAPAAAHFCKCRSWARARAAAAAERVDAPLVGKN